MALRVPGVRFECYKVRMLEGLTSSPGLAHFATFELSNRRYAAPDAAIVVPIGSPRTARSMLPAF
jgi:hypothetical protein